MPQSIPRAAKEERESYYPPVGRGIPRRAVQHSRYAAQTGRGILAGLQRADEQHCSRWQSTQNELGSAPARFASPSQAPGWVRSR